MNASMKSLGYCITESILFALAIPAWGLLIYIIPGSPGFGGSPLQFFVAPISLCCGTVAIWRLLRTLPHAWPLSALVAGYGFLAALYVAVVIGRAE